jgi:hypothetical protein
MRFHDDEDIKKNMTAGLAAILCEAFADCFPKLFKRFNECIQVG